MLWQAPVIAARLEADVAEKIAVVVCENEAWPREDATFCEREDASDTRGVADEEFTDEGTW